MKVALILTLAVSVGCRQNPPPTQTSASNEYKILSYDAEWQNQLGNEGQFVLQRDNVKTTAFCGVKNCLRHSARTRDSILSRRDFTRSE